MPPLVTWDHPHSDNSVGAQGADMLVKTPTEGQRIFPQQFNFSKEGWRPQKSQRHAIGRWRGTTEGGRE